MVDYHGTEAVIRMMATHPAVRKRGCARLVHALVVDTCISKSVAKLCVELSENDATADSIWAGFGYTPARSGIIGSTTAPIFKDTKLLAMNVPHAGGVAALCGLLTQQHVVSKLQNEQALVYTSATQLS